MKAIVASLAFSACLLLPATQTAFATGQPGTTAGVNCGTSTGPALPGNSASSPGAPFNEPAPVGTGAGGVAGHKYAGNPGTASLANANSPNAVSQYDIACAVNQSP